jgi:dienelactone hydrolase
MKSKRKYLIPIGLLCFFVVAYFVVDSILFDGVKPKAIRLNGFQGNYYAKNEIEKSTAIVLLGGGQWGDYWAQHFAEHEMVGFSLPYTGREGLPNLPENIELEYFEKAMQWLSQQPEVNPDKLVLMGASKNSELALVLASRFPDLVDAVVAYAPSSVSWSNTALPYNSDTLMPSWTHKGLAIPYIPMDKISPNSSGEIDMLKYWETGLAKGQYIDQASIPVEKINGPILLISGNHDKIWPSSRMADMIEKRLVDNAFSYEFINLKYDNSGHSISGNPDDNRSYGPAYLRINGQDYEYDFGGDAEGDFAAKQDARKQLMKFLKF